MVGSLALGPATSPAADFDLTYVRLDGSRCGEPLASCWTVPFERVLQVRKFSSFRGKRSFAGLWWSCTTDDHVGFESWLERDHVMALDFDPAVVGFSSQPFRLSWQEAGKTRSHTPDYFARLSDGTGVVVDVRADDRIERQDMEAFAATARACESVGWQFRRVGALDAVRAANLRWLAGYRHPRCLHARRAADLQRVFRDPVPLLDGVGRVGDPIAVLPTLFHLLWRHVLETDLDSSPLAASSMVWCHGGDRT
ncbi:TnsA-like heteromeric transposase endonuclease subunit [Amycolatopsis magusensis]|uniref:TnsA-like heteromeric transposase endonuclease subunit n=1 Tax=Amycolatopsis magusensis TaxID=882444 RepID=UPI0024A7FA04|nr:TnsA-like heteromeric transposase endonuclease subunit [Amycolatopsis magusensis]MDI5975855.1 TnsA-like heteromeric transposase endonuclease subunit [Amycolatopsis magusensis]